VTTAAPGARRAQPSVEAPIRAAEVVGALSLRDGRLVDGREYFFDLHAWDEFWA
jgi:ketosteroid isomerase-like protein